MSMAHEEAASRLVEYLYGELDGRARTEFETHLGGCTRCRGELDGFQRTRALVRAADEEPPTLARVRILDAARLQAAAFALVRAAASPVAETATGTPAAPDKVAAVVDGPGKPSGGGTTRGGRARAPSMGDWLSWDWFRVHWQMPTLATLGVAAALVLLLSNKVIDPGTSDAIQRKAAETAGAIGEEQAPATGTVAGAPAEPGFLAPPAAGNAPIPFPAVEAPAPAGEGAARAGEGADPAAVASGAPLVLKEANRGERVTARLDDNKAARHRAFAADRAEEAAAKEQAGAAPAERAAEGSVQLGKSGTKRPAKNLDDLLGVMSGSRKGAAHAKDAERQSAEPFRGNFDGLGRAGGGGGISPGTVGTGAGKGAGLGAVGGANRGDGALADQKHSQKKSGSVGGRVSDPFAAGGDTGGREKENDASSPPSRYRRTAPTDVPAAPEPKPVMEPRASVSRSELAPPAARPAPPPTTPPVPRPTFAPPPGYAGGAAAAPASAPRGADKRWADEEAAPAADSRDESEARRAPAASARAPARVQEPARPTTQAGPRPAPGQAPSPAAATPGRASVAASSMAEAAPGPEQKQEASKRDARPQQQQKMRAAQADQQPSGKMKTTQTEQQQAPDLATALARADRLYQDHRFREAKEAYETLLRRYPTHPDGEGWRKRVAACVEALR